MALPIVGALVVAFLPGAAGKSHLAKVVSFGISIAALVLVANDTRVWSCQGEAQRRCRCMHHHGGLCIRLLLAQHFLAVVV